MFDLLMTILVLIPFAATVAYVRACADLTRPPATSSKDGP
jgi:hypothetical protein